ncbi:fimbria/pilus chaperone family protein [Oceanisphaera sp. KMM 10153]|uniref:fimbria/pilus chaperone family protein n=1 Tax=Oceanisphaera submarina TaxID=3390193 RepID=UPI003976A0A7
MKTQFKKHLLGALIGTAAALTGVTALATGMQPETSVVILDEGQGEVSINVKNTDDTPSLLYTTIENIPEDQETLVVLTPPVARVEAGETQLVRFLRRGGEPSATQRLKRVIFEGIAQRPDANGRARVGVTVRQNLPLLIHPKGLERHREPWTLLKWRMDGDKLVVVNDSPYVVRLAQELTLKPSGQQALLPRTYVLPGETLPVSAKDPISATSVTIAPATVYGYAVEHYDAEVGAS